MDLKLISKVLVIVNLFILASGMMNCNNEPGREIWKNNRTLLDISNCTLTKIELGDLEDTESLLEIEANMNNLTTLEAKTFDGLNLTKLSLLKNQIQEIDVNAFTGLPDLIELVLTGNAITKLEEGVFRELTKLEDLYLAMNQIKVLPSNIFINNTNLKIINLVDNKIIGISNQTFVKQNPFAKLQLDGNICINKTIYNHSGIYQQLKTCFDTYEIHQNILDDEISKIPSQECTTIEPTPKVTDDIEKEEEEETTDISVTYNIPPTTTTAPTHIEVSHSAPNKVQAVNPTAENDKSMVLYGIIAFQIIIINVVIIYLFKLKNTIKEVTQINQKIAHTNEVIKRQSAMQVQSAKTVQPAQSDQSDQLVQPAKPAESDQPAQSDQSDQSGQPAKPAESDVIELKEI